MCGRTQDFRRFTIIRVSLSNDKDSEESKSKFSIRLTLRLSSSKRLIITLDSLLTMKLPLERALFALMQLTRTHLLMPRLVFLVLSGLLHMFSHVNSAHQLFLVGLSSITSEFIAIQLRAGLAIIFNKASIRLLNLLLRNTPFASLKSTLNENFFSVKNILGFCIQKRTAYLCLLQLYLNS